MNCYGCYMEVKKKDFCPKCSKKLFGSKNISAKLSFEKPEFVTYINNNSKRFSISGVQDKASLKISDTQLALTDISGEYILKRSNEKNEVLKTQTNSAIIGLLKGLFTMRCKKRRIFAQNVQVMM